MAQRTDLYSILVSYANKNNSPYIGIESFLGFLGRYARKKSEEQPEWYKWLQDRPVKFWAEMSVLVEDGKCELLTDTADGRIYMPHFYLEVLDRAYRNPDEDADLPFPSEESLRITLPDDRTRPLSFDYDLLAYMDEPQDSDNPILKINFPEGFGSALVLASMIPHRLTEMALLKIRNYLRKSGNKEYAFRKLTPQLQGKESNLKDQLTRILTRPSDCYSAIEGGGEFSYLFWAHFSILIKSDIKKKKEYLSDDIAALQSVYIIEAISGYFKSLMVKQREAELAFKSLESHLAKPPYLYTLDQIIKFTNPKGVLLLSQYTNEALEEWLRKKTTESENNELPVLLVVQGAKNERCFLLKDKALTLCARLLAEARIQVKDAVSKHWRTLLAEYRSEPAMENDSEFNKALFKFAKRLCPGLTNLLEDPKLLLVYEEVEQNQNGVPPPAEIFNKGQLLPYSALFLIRRKEILADAKLILPFWYSMPIITAIIAFFKNLARKRKAVKLSPDDNANSAEGVPEEKDPAGEIRAAAEDIEFALVPPGHTLDSYLEELESRWSRLINKQARENLIEDVKSLIRDNLRRNLKIQKNFHLTQEIINQMAVNIVTRTPALASLSGRDSLILYSELYLVKLLESTK